MYLARKWSYKRRWICYENCATDEHFTFVDVATWRRQTKATKSSHTALQPFVMRSLRLPIEHQRLRRILGEEALCQVPTFHHSLSNPLLHLDRLLHRLTCPLHHDIKSGSKGNPSPHLHSAS